MWCSTTGQVRRAIKERETVEVPPEDAWRVPYLQKLLEQRLKHHYKGEKEEETKVQSYINSLCVN